VGGADGENRLTCVESAANRRFRAANSECVSQKGLFCLQSDKMTKGIRELALDRRDRFFSDPAFRDILELEDKALHKRLDVFKQRQGELVRAGGQEEAAHNLQVMKAALRSSGANRCLRSKRQKGNRSFASLGVHAHFKAERETIPLFFPIRR